MQGRKILLAITGSIAAYKCAMLIRLWVKSGAEVQVLMTEASTEFISPLTISTLSRNRVLTNLLDGETWSNHVELGLWAEVMVVAPCTANTIAKMAIGMSDNMVLATYLSARCPVVIAPAMDLDMWKHPSTLSNVETLKSHAVSTVPVGHGELASGLIGDGRMAEPEVIFDFVEEILRQPKMEFLGKKILITAGPTHEPIDPVRYIGNRSSGKMGIALAEAFANIGAEVILVLGPSVLKTNHKNVKTINVQTADEMYDVCMSRGKDMDIAVMAAAVADYKPTVTFDDKVKKKDSNPLWTIELIKNKDIAAALGKVKSEKQILVGFALETSNAVDNAKKKLKKKNLDIIVLNSLQDQGAGFGYDTNKITIIHKNGTKHNFKLKPKDQVARDIIDSIASVMINEE